MLLHVIVDNVWHFYFYSTYVHRHDIIFGHLHVHIVKGNDAYFRYTRPLNTMRAEKNS